MVNRIRMFDGVKYVFKEQFTSKIKAWLEAGKYRNQGYGARTIPQLGEASGRKYYNVYKSMKKL